MTEVKSDAEQALEAERQHQEKVALKGLIIAKRFNRKDYRDAVEALNAEREDWEEFDFLIAYAHQVDPDKGWDHYLEMSQGDLEDTILNG